MFQALYKQQDININIIIILSQCLKLLQVTWTRQVVTWSFLVNNSNAKFTGDGKMSFRKHWVMSLAVHSSGSLVSTAVLRRLSLHCYMFNSVVWYPMIISTLHNQQCKSTSILMPMNHPTMAPCLLAKHGMNFLWLWQLQVASDGLRSTLIWSKI